MKISVCVDALFNGKDFVESLGAIKKAGIDAIEFWSWWDKDLDKVKKAKEELGIEIIAFCTKMVSLVDASKRTEYLVGLRESIKVAKALDCKTLISQVGNELYNSTEIEQHENLVEGLRACAPILEEEGITLVIEPLNILVDHMGYYLSRSKEAFKIIDEVGRPNVKVLYDIYHQQITEGHLISTITSNIDKIGHFHAAGNPGRGELTTGEINYIEIFRAIDAGGYKGFAGLEYFPKQNAVDGLKSLLHIINAEVGLKGVDARCTD